MIGARILFYRPTLRGAPAAVAVAFLMASVGCTSGGEEAAATNNACGVAPGVDVETVKVGLVYPDTGAYAALLTPVRGAVEARIGLQNDNGGVAGRTIELEWRDDAGDPGQNLSASQDLVENEDAFSVLQIGLAAAGAADYLEDKGVPVVGPATDSTWTTHRNMFSYSYGYGDGNTVTTFGQYVAEAGGTKAFIVDDGATAGGGLGDSLELSAQSQQIQIVGREPFSPAVDSAARLAERIAASGADVVLGGVLGPSFAPVVQAVNAARLPLKAILGISGYDSGLLQQYGSGLAGMSVYLPYAAFESDSPAIQSMRSALQKYSPQLAVTDTEAAMQAYISTDLMIRGLEAAGACPTRASFLTGLRGVGDYQAGGLLPGPVDLERDFGRISPCYNFVKVDPTGQHFEAQSVPATGQASWCGEVLQRSPAASTG